MDSEKRIFVIPHFHYDIAWITTEKENLKTVYKIFDAVMTVMRKDEDFKFVRHLGASMDFREVMVDISNFRTANQGNPSFWRTGLKIRVSSRKAARLAKELFANSTRVEG